MPAGGKKPAEKSVQLDDTTDKVVSIKDYRVAAEVQRTHLRIASLEEEVRSATKQLIDFGLSCKEIQEIIEKYRRDNTNR